MKKHYPAYKIVDTESEAKAFCAERNDKATAYERSKYKAHYTPWSGSDGYNGFVCWYYYKNY